MFQPPYKNILSPDCIYVFSSPVSTCIKQPELHTYFFASSFSYSATANSATGSPHCPGFTITLRHTTFGRTSLDEWSSRRTDLYLTTQIILKKQTSMPPAGFEPAISAVERTQTHALDRVATGIVA